MDSSLALLGGHPVRSGSFTRWPIVGQSEIDRLRQVVERGVWSSNGPEEKQFDREFARFCGAESAQCVANGSVALELALRALRIGPGDEVIVPALTWTATAWAAVQVGARPVFADVSPDDWCLDVTSLGHCFTERTRAVITVHLYDQISEIDAILETGKKKAVAVVEDCAHAHGARWRGRGVGTFGALGTFSFQQHKSLTCGEGGSVTTQDLSLADRVYALKDCGRQRVAGSAIGFGGNYRISEFQAAILNAQLERLPEQLALKVTRLSQLRNHLNDVRGIDMLPHKENVTRPGSYMIALRYDPTEFDGLARELLIEAMQAEGIPLIPPYEVVYASDLWRSGVGFLDLDEPEHALGLGANCPVAEDISRRTGLALPQSLLLGSEQDVVDVIRAFAKVKRHITALLKRGRRRNRSRQLRQFFKRTP